MLWRAQAVVDGALRQQDAERAANAFIFREVHAVLDEMVHDVEAWDHECELAKLRHELYVTQQALDEAKQREQQLLEERQRAYDFAAQVEEHGKALVAQLNDNLQTLVSELNQKHIIEKELARAREQLVVASQLSSQLSSAQREIRELHRKMSIEKLLKGSHQAMIGKGATSKRATGTPPCTPSTQRPKSSSVNEVVVASHMPVASGAGSPGREASPSSSRRLGWSPNTGSEAQREPCLETCPEKLLMSVFGYLDARSVVAVSMTNKIIMSRVHGLFGVATPMAVPPVVKRTQSQPVLPSARSAISKTRSVIGFGSTTEKDKVQLSKVEQLVKSMKVDEMKLFQEMSLRIRALESNLAQVQAEKEDVAARLHGAENVRDFLMDKLKDLEDALANAMELNAKKDEQAVMDREIVGFLDARTQEYELTLQKCAEENEQSRNEIVQLRDEHEAKLAVVQDMVKLLTEAKQDLEAQLRSQRKVLVREVKALRAQNEQLRADKSQYCTQLKQLKHALHNLDQFDESNGDGADGWGP
ncbi:TPA: hypothetical protein N0F65_010675 [Lagenidium giganteum]|uniref:F-box domain-containing protein n=1 Tax=Lagenidium giganteum TaxID=4803 RepID=A0AAV2ZAW8_9STRA|nr:TPA: hypothetical protein N0F65_010675 [Lagenidium giganteum]